MKKLLIVIAQFILFVVVDGVGSLFYQPFHVRTTLSSDPLAQRVYVWDGVILMLIVYVVLLLIAAIRKRMGTSTPLATVALVLAAIAGYVLKFGFVTRNW